MLNYTDEAGIHFFRLAPDLGNDRIVKGHPAPASVAADQQQSVSRPGPEPGPAGP